MRKFRSLLYLPGDNQRFIEKSAVSHCDAVIFDLEDSVSLEHKSAARQMTADALKRFRGNKLPKQLIVRVNGMDSVLGYLDILQIAPLAPDTILVPKADRRSISSADSLLSAVEREYNLPAIGMIGLIETARGLVQMREMLEETERLTGLQFGAEDFTRDLSIRRTPEGTEVLQAKQQMALYCHAYGIDAIDTPYTKLNDPQGLEEEIQASRLMGFTGKAAIHPEQLEWINNAFMPTDEQIAHARRLLAAYTEAVGQGRGSVSFEGAMIDRPIAERARKLLEDCQL